MPPGPRRDRTGAAAAHFNFQDHMSHISWRTRLADQLTDHSVGLATRALINSVAGCLSRGQHGLVESEAEAVPTSSDGRWLVLAELGQREREMTQALWAVRSQIAHLVEDALPPHVRSAQVEEAVRASGYSRTLIDALRRGQHEWNRWPRT